MHSELVFTDPYFPVVGVPLCFGSLTSLLGYLHAPDGAIIIYMNGSRSKISSFQNGNILDTTPKTDLF